MKTLQSWGLGLLVLGIVVGASGAAFIYSGIYNIGADAPHTRPVYWLIEKMRDRSVTVRAASIDVPPLDDSDLLLSGGPDYAEMCSGCHLEPGVNRSEIRDGLYPQPPDLTERSDRAPAEVFWAIKHGIKLSAMPAWGPTHTDERIWAMVAFINRLPDLTPDQYQILTVRQPGGEGHQHGSDAHE